MRYLQSWDLKSGAVTWHHSDEGTLGSSSWVQVPGHPVNSLLVTVAVPLSPDVLMAPFITIRVPFIVLSNS